MLMILGSLLKGLGWFIGLWVVYWFAWFIALGLLMFLIESWLIRAGNKTVRIREDSGFWVSFWYGFMSSVMHCILYLLFFR